jgi:MoxR-like ATPase
MSDMVRGIFDELRKEWKKVIVGQDEVFELLVISLLCEGHVLLEGVPGTAKTLMSKTLALIISGDFKRVQFTPDLMPSDIIGTSVFDLQTGRFNLKKGPIFTNIFLADEINRAPAKTQSALLECMEERQVTIEGVRYRLQPPFMVLATQNPIEYEGTYPLPEALLDRFLFKLLIDYPSRDEERQILLNYHAGFDAHNLEAIGIKPVMDAEMLSRCKEEIRKVTVDDSVLGYIISIAEASRSSADLMLGGSPRASVVLLLACKAYAAIQGREYVLPDDVKYLTPHVYRHRIILKPEAEIEGITPDTAIERLLGSIEVPR